MRNNIIDELREKRENIKNILILKLRGIGDVVLSSAAIENISLYFKNAKIDLLTEKPSAQIMMNFKSINRVHIFNRKSTVERIKLAFFIRKQKYDLVFDFFSNPSTAQITFLSGAKFRAGFPYKGRKYAYNILGPEERGKYHAASLHLEFLKCMKIPVITEKLGIGLTEEDKKFAVEYFDRKGLNKQKILGVSPSGGWASKKCEPDKFAEFAREIFNKFNFKSLVVWGPGDKDDAMKIQELLGDMSVMAPNTSLRQMAALLKQCDAVIANDSGPMHIATAVETPVLSLHGPTNPALQGPFGNTNESVRYEELDCIGCNLLECNRNHECFLELDATRVLNKFELLLKKNNLLC